MVCLGFLIQSMTGGEDRDILSGVALRRAHITDAAVGMVIPMHEGCAQVRADSRSAKPRFGNSSRYLAVRKSDSTKALSSETRGRE